MYKQLASKVKNMFKSEYINTVFQRAAQRNGNEPEFLQAVEEVLESVELVLPKWPQLEESGVIEQLIEPERFISFRVPWVDDAGVMQINRGYRCQFNSAVGPYKGGLRFHESVNSSVMKFLAFEQTFKNSLTGLPMGGAKGGSDFDPKGKSDGEVMRFCQSFMCELYRHIGRFTDIPAGDIGVGAREIGYLYGQYKRLANETGGAITGKGVSYGGSLARKEATGYGVCYFVQNMLARMKNDGFEGKTVVVSGSGNVAIYACEKAQSLGAKVVAMSDSSGYIYDEQGIDLQAIKLIKEQQRARISLYTGIVGRGKFVAGASNIWNVACHIALPCATQNELDVEGAKALIANGVQAVVEGANMPSTPEAVKLLQKNGVLFGPAKAANAGGVATSCLEMSQNAQHTSWPFERVDQELHRIMENIFNSVYAAAQEYGEEGNLVAGANIAGFLKVAQAMLAMGVV